jgi:HAD superfamily hydrolase (TIGR01509 family)
VFEAIIFDNDGVLVDTEALYFRASREVLASVGVTLDEAGYVEHFLREGRGAWHLAAARGAAPADIDALRAARDRRYVELLDGADLIIPGVAELVPSLARRYRLAIVTSSAREPFVRVHTRTGLLAHFELVLTRPDYVEAKPHPEPYLRALARLELAAERCLVIEDSERGLRAAKSAGLACWVVPSALTRGCRFDGADARFDSLGAVAAALLDGDPGQSTPRNASNASRSSSSS